MKLNYEQAGFIACARGRKLSDHEYSPGSMPEQEWKSGWQKCSYGLGLEDIHPYDLTEQEVFLLRDN